MSVVGAAAFAASSKRWRELRFGFAFRAHLGKWLVVLRFNLIMVLLCLLTPGNLWQRNVRVDFLIVLENAALLIPDGTNNRMHCERTMGVVVGPWFFAGFSFESSGALAVLLVVGSRVISVPRVCVSSRLGLLKFFLGVAGFVSSDC